MEYYGPKCIEPIIRDIYELCSNESWNLFHRQDTPRVIAAPIEHVRHLGGRSITRFDLEGAAQIDNYYDNLCGRVIRNDKFFDDSGTDSWQREFDVLCTVAAYNSPIQTATIGYYEELLDAVIIKPDAVLRYMYAMLAEDGILAHYHGDAFGDENLDIQYQPRLINTRQADELDDGIKNYIEEQLVLPSEILSIFHKWDLAKNYAIQDITRIVRRGRVPYFECVNDNDFIANSDDIIKRSLVKTRYSNAMDLLKDCQIHDYMHMISRAIAKIHIPLAPHAQAHPKVEAFTKVIDQFGIPLFTEIAKEKIGVAYRKKQNVFDL